MKTPHGQAHRSSQGCQFNTIWYGALLKQDLILDKFTFVATKDSRITPAAAQHRLQDSGCSPAQHTKEKQLNLRLTKYSLRLEVLLYGKRNRIWVLTAQRHLMISDKMCLANSVLNIL